MTALIIVAAVLLLLALLLFAEGSITLKYDGELTVTANALFVKLRLLPKKEKKVRLRDFSLSKYEKMLEKDRAAAEKKQAKKAEKDEKKKQKKAEKAAENKPKKTISETVDGIKDYAVLVGDVLKTFFGHLRIDVCRAVVTVGGKDASSAAVTYGIVSQSVAYLMELLASVTHFKRKYNEKIDVRADFLSDKISADLEVRFRVRVIHILHVALRGGVGFIKIRSKNS